MNWNPQMLILYLALFFLLNHHHYLPVEASLACNTTAECKSLLRSGSECLDSFCSNPFHKGGCLRNMMPNFTTPRVCSSMDSPEAAIAGHCRIPDPRFNYLEIRIGVHNWETSILIPWILQIILSELLDIPVSIETGKPNVTSDFYDRNGAFEWGSGNFLWGGLNTSADIQDCRKLQQDDFDEYIPCLHFEPEIWELGQYYPLVRDKIAEHALGLGMYGEEFWFVPKFTIERYPFLGHYVGLQGPENRKRLADIFLRPTKWKDYCDIVSPNNCTTNDGIAVRAPVDEKESSSFFSSGLYTGYFRKTEKNYCKANETLCTGHIADYPCGWSSNVMQLTKYLDIGLESDGDDEASGYTYSQLGQIWDAANATKSDVMMQYWMPESLVERYVSTEAQFERVTLPPPTQDCYENKVSSVDRCSPDPSVQVGSPLGVCGEAPNTIYKGMSSGLYDATHDPTIPDGLRSPAFESLQLFTITSLQIGKLFEYWFQQNVDKWGYDVREGVCRWVVENFEEIQTNFVPKSYPRTIVKNKDFFESPLFFVSLCISILSILFTTFTAGMTFRQRKRRVMVYAQVEFLFLLLVGLMMVCTSSLLLSLSPTDFTCVLSMWLTNVGYTLELVPLIVKMAAFYRLMLAAENMRRIKVDRKSLFEAVAVLTLIVVLFSALWTILNPPGISSKYFVTDKQNEDGKTIVHEIDYCSSGSDPWKYTTVGWHCCLLLCATIQAFQTRGLNKKIRETHTLAIMIYSHFVFVMLRLITLFLEDHLTVTNMTAFRSLIFSIDTIATICMYFVPKFLSNDPVHEQTVFTSQLFQMQLSNHHTHPTAVEI